MKYKWNIEILFNNGEHVYGEIECHYNISSEVAENFFKGKTNSFNTMRGVYEENKAQIFFRLGDISCFKIQQEPFYIREKIK